VLKDSVQEAEDVAHALWRKTVLQKLPAEVLDIGRSDVGDLALAEVRGDMDALHVLACLTIGLADAA
jgi:hypothetical protein